MLQLLQTVRRDLHRIPELDDQLPQTTASGSVAEIRSAVLEGNTYYFIRLEQESVFWGRVMLPQEKQEQQSFQRPQRLPMHGLWVMPTVRTRKISRLRLSWRIPDQAVSMQFRSQKRFLMHIISKQGRKDISVLVA